MKITNQRTCLQNALTWYEDLQLGSVEDYEVKLMLVGNGRVGNTSTLKQLMNQDFDPAENSTHGIELYNHEDIFPACEEGLRIQAWDFGGQEIYHATHRLFMQSRALYLALWDWET